MLADKLFVYGTLKKNFSNHEFLKDAEFLYDAYTLTKFQMLDLGYYPALVKDEDEYYIKGEVYKINKNILSSVDVLEGYPDFYSRELTPINMSNLMAYVYFLKNNFKNYNNYVRPVSGKKYLEWRKNNNEFRF